MLRRCVFFLPYVHTFLTICSQKELATFVETEQAQARVQQSVHKLTSMCWDKYVHRLLQCGLVIIFVFRCINSQPSTRFARGEDSCIVNCVERFLDTSLFMVKRIEEQREHARLN